MVQPSVYVVILTGGAGTRFWPLSRQTQPKQFLNILGPCSLFQETLGRIKPLAAPAHIFVVTNQKYKRLVENQSKAFHVPPKNILCEVAVRNTAPAIAWAASRIYAQDKDALD